MFFVSYEDLISKIISFLLTLFLMFYVKNFLYFHSVKDLKEILKIFLLFFSMILP